MIAEDDFEIRRLVRRVLEFDGPAKSKKWQMRPKAAAAPPDYDMKS